MVLFVIVANQGGVLAAHFHDHGSPPHAQRFRDSASTHRQCAAADGLLLGRPAAFAFVLFTFSFPAFTILGGHGRSSNGLSRWPAPGERSLVFLYCNRPAPL